MPISTRRDTTPSRNCSTSTCCSGVGERGRKAEMSVVNVVRVMTAMHAAAKTSQAAMHQRCAAVTARPA